jgi:hypothetical protein
MKPEQLHRLRRIGEGTSTGGHDRGAPDNWQVILCTLVEYMTGHHPV